MQTVIRIHLPVKGTFWFMEEEHPLQDVSAWISS